MKMLGLDRIDLLANDDRPSDAGERESRNLDRFCRVVATEDWAAVAARLKAAYVKVDGEPRSRWGAQGRGTSLSVFDRDGNQLELKSYP